MIKYIIKQIKIRTYEFIHTVINKFVNTLENCKIFQNLNLLSSQKNFQQFISFILTMWLQKKNQKNQILLKLGQRWHAMSSSFFIPSGIKYQKNVYFVILSIQKPDAFLERVKAYFNLWDVEQWSTSIIGLIVMYLVAGYFYNKWLEKTIRGKWLDIPSRLNLIGFDLGVNFALGIYYMNHRDTIMGQIMITCPIAISPLIFIGELICVTIYYYYASTPRVVKFWGIMNQKPYRKKLKFLWRCWLYWIAKGRWRKK